MDTSSSENSSSTVLPQIRGDAPPDGEVRTELERVLSSTLFRDAEGLKRFLRYTVEHTLQGEGDQLKEYRLGVDVFDRDSSFDPRLDPVVRMAARRLRSKLSEYYETEGCQDAVWIDVPKGGYAATFGGKPTPDPLLPPTFPATAASKSPRRIVILLASALLLVCIALAIAYRLRPKPAFSQIEVAAHTRRSVAVLGFANVSGRTDKAWLSTAFSEMLTTELAAGEQLRTVAGESVARMKISLSLSDGDSYGRDTLAKIRQNLDAEDVVVGSYVFLGKDQLRLDLRLQDTVSGETLAAVSAKGSEAEIDDLVSRAGSVLREKLGVGAVSIAQAAAIKATLPSNRDSARLYSEGLVKLRNYDNLGARDALTKALTLEPKFALGHAALATAWSSLGYDGKAREESKKALDLSADLSSEERLWIEAHYRELAEGPDKAVATYRILFQSFPDNLEYGLRLAYVQYHASKGQDALATIAQLRKLAPPGGDDPRHDVGEADAAFSLGDYKRYHLAAARGAEKALVRGARLLAAEALADDCWALKTLGRPKEATAACDQALAIFSAANDRDFVAAVLNEIAVILHEQGDLEAAKAKLEQALSVSREVGDRDGSAAEMGNLANILDAEGDLRGAKAIYEQAFVVFREVGDKSGSSEALGDIARMLGRIGDLSGARARLEGSLAIARDSENKGQYAFDLANLGELLYLQGDLTGAETTLQQAETTLHQADDKKSQSYALWLWGKVLSAKGDLSGARQKYEDALKIRNETGAKEEIAQSQVGLAELAIDEDHPADAEGLCRQALQQFSAAQAADDQILTHAVLARALLAGGKLPDAQREIEAARELAAKSQNFAVRVRMAVTAARIRAALGNPSEAEKNLEAAIADSTKHGFVPYALESRLALGEIEASSGKMGSGRVLLAALQRDAAMKGFSLIADRAAAAFRLPGRVAQDRGPHA